MTCSQSEMTLRQAESVLARAILTPSSRLARQLPGGPDTALAALQVAFRCQLENPVVRRAAARLLGDVAAWGPVEWRERIDSFSTLVESTVRRLRRDPVAARLAELLSAATQAQRVTALYWWYADPTSVARELSVAHVELRGVKRKRREPRARALVSAAAEVIEGPYSRYLRTLHALLAEPSTDMSKPPIKMSTGVVLRDIARRWPQHLDVVFSNAALWRNAKCHGSYRYIPDTEEIVFWDNSGVPVSIKRREFEREIRRAHEIAGWLAPQLVHALFINGGILPYLRENLELLTQATAELELHLKRGAGSP